MGKNIALFIIMVFLLACQNQGYKPEGLTKLSHQGIKDRVKKGIKPNPYVIVKNQKGEIISSDSISKIKDIEK